MLGHTDAQKAAKKGENLASEPTVGLGAQDVAGATAADDAALVDGLTIEEYARKFGVSEAETWRRLRRGELIGRTQRGRLIIFGTPASAEAANDTAVDGGLADLPPEPTFTAAPELAPGQETIGEPDLSFLPPLPSDEGEAKGDGAESPGHYLTLAGERSGTPELALLLDHLSLAKEENREILRMTQESIRKVSELSDTIVEMKDAVIDAKDAQIHALREQLEARERELKRLRQQNEDLEMLARTAVKENLP